MTDQPPETPAPDATSVQVVGLLRNGLMMLGAGLVTNGSITASQEQAIVGGILAVGSVIWSIWQKHTANEKLKAALELPAVKLVPRA